MDYGWTSLCVGSKDLDASKHFYEALESAGAPEACLQALGAK